MSGAEGSRAGISYTKETAWGVTPTAQFTGVNFITDDLTYPIESEESENVRPDRQNSGITQVGADCSGGLQTVLQAVNADTLFPGFFMEADWTADVIQNGVVRSSYSIERAFYDVNQFFLYTGMVPSVLDIEIEAGSKVMCNMSFVGEKEVLNQLTASSTAPTALVTGPDFTAGGSVADISVAGVTVPSCLVQKLNIKLDNKVEGKTGVGSLGNCDAKAKSLAVSGEIDLFFNDETYYDRYLAGTAFSISTTLTDSLGNSYLIEIPECKFTDGNAPVSGRDDSVIEAHPFMASVGSGGFTIKMTRTVV
jgi:hypothetical protein